MSPLGRSRFSIHVLLPIRHLELVARLAGSLECLVESVVIVAAPSGHIDVFCWIERPRSKAARIKFPSGISRKAVQLEPALQPYRVRADVLPRFRIVVP